MFDEEYFENLPNDPILAGLHVCKEILDLHRRSPTAQQFEQYDEYLLALGLFGALNEAYSLKFDSPPLTGNKSDNIRRIAEFFQAAETEMTKNAAQITVERFKTQFARKFGRIFSYEFSEGDLNRIQQLINEVRQLISDSKLLSENHKGRLLKRLETLQSELHKKVSDLDRFWGLIGEAGVVIGKFGNDVKPIVDRIREIAEIVWRTQARAEELPSGLPLPMLGQGDEEWRRLTAATKTTW